MNTQAKRRLIIVTLLIVMIAIVILAVVGSGNMAKSISVTEAASGSYDGQRVEVSGTVVDNTYTTTDDGVTFQVYDPDDQENILNVSYQGAVPATFGNGVTAISTGTLSSDGELQASKLVTKCPSKYESAEGALTVANLLASADRYTGSDNIVKLAGYVKAGTLTAAGTGDDRFTLYSQDKEIAVVYEGALADTITDDSSVVLTGYLAENGKFIASDVAEEKVGD